MSYGVVYEWAYFLTNFINVFSTIGDVDAGTTSHIHIRVQSYNEAILRITFFLKG